MVEKSKNSRRTSDTFKIVPFCLRFVTNNDEKMLYRGNKKKMIIYAETDWEMHLQVDGEHLKGLEIFPEKKACDYEKCFQSCGAAQLFGISGQILS